MPIPCYPNRLIQDLSTDMDDISDEMLNVGHEIDDIWYEIGCQRRCKNEE
jgi:hypothetical protein